MVVRDGCVADQEPPDRTWRRHQFDATWAKGDTKNVISTSATSPNFLMVGGGSGQLGTGQSLPWPTTDGVYLPTAAGGDGTIHLTRRMVSVVRSTTTGIRTGRAACSAAWAGAV